MRNRTWLRALVAGTVVALTATACGGGAAGSDREGPLVIVVPEEPPTLEPCDAPFTATGRVVRANITEALTERDPTSGDVLEALSSKWTRKGSKTWTFDLRSGVKFHDGSAFSAADVVHSVDRMMTTELNCNVKGYVFDGLDVEAKEAGENTVEITTSEPDPILPLRMSFVEIVSDSASADKKVREPVGTGPYELSAWDAGRSITVKRFGGYWGTKPKIPTARYLWREEGSVRASMVTNGEADIALNLAPEDGAGDLARTFPTNETSYLRLDATRAPLDDIRVRQAINYAIDRQGLVQSVFAGIAEPAGQIIPDNVSGYNPAVKPWPFDKAKAKQLIASAKADGVPVDAKITIIGRNGIYPKAAEAMEAAQGMLREVGLDVDIKMLEVNAWTEWLLRPFPNDRGPTLLQAQHGNQAGDASFTMGQIYGAEGAQSSYGTKQLDKLIDAGERASGDARDRAFQEAFAYQNEKVVRDAVMAHMKGIIALSPRATYKPNAATPDELRLGEISISE